MLRVSIRKDTVHCKNVLPGVWDEDLAAVLHERIAVFGEDSAPTVLRVRPVWGQVALTDLTAVRLGCTNWEELS